MPKAKLLIVDDDQGFTAKLAGALEGLFDVDLCQSEAEFQERFAVGRYDLLMMDMRLKREREGLDLLKGVLARDPQQAAIVMTAYADTDSHADAMGSGALTYLDKRSFSPTLIARTVEAFVAQGVLRRRLAALERQLAASEHQDMVGTSEGIKSVLATVHQAASANVPTVFLGEPGSGRELAARSIHRLNRRRSKGPFVKVSCARLLEGDPLVALFGGGKPTEKGKSLEARGWVDDAKGGVLFLEGVSSLGKAGCAAVANLVSTLTFQRVGGSGMVSAECQVVISLEDAQSSEETEKILSALRESGGFVQTVPPLRERRGDIAQIAQYSLDRYYRLGRAAVRSFRTSALAALELQPWPGNVRELRLAVEYAAVRAVAEHAREVGPEHLPLAAVETATRPFPETSSFDYQANLARAELGLVDSAIERFDTTKKSLLSERLGYNDRFAFARRVQRAFQSYPLLRKKFPRTADLFPESKSRKGGK